MNLSQARGVSAMTIVGIPLCPTNSELQIGKQCKPVQVHSFSRFSLWVNLRKFACWGNIPNPLRTSSPMMAARLKIVSNASKGASALTFVLTLTHKKFSIKLWDCANTG